MVFRVLWQSSTNPMLSADMGHIFPVSLATKVRRELSFHAPGIDIMGEIMVPRGLTIK